MFAHSAPTSREGRLVQLALDPSATAAHVGARNARRGTHTLGASLGPCCYSLPLFPHPQAAVALRGLRQWSAVTRTGRSRQVGRSWSDCGPCLRFLVQTAMVVCRSVAAAAATVAAKEWVEERVGQLDDSTGHRRMKEAADPEQRAAIICWPTDGTTKRDEGRKCMKMNFRVAHQASARDLRPTQLVNNDGAITASIDAKRVVHCRNVPRVPAPSIRRESSAW